MFETQSHNLTNPDDLAINKQGRVSPAQLSAFQYHRSQRTPQLVVVFAIALMVGVILALDVQQASPGESGLDIAPFFIIVAAALGFIVVPAVVNFVWVNRVKWELAERRVDAAYGQVEWKRGAYVIAADERRLRLIFSDSPNLLPGSYRFYYLPETGGLLSAEMLNVGDRSEALTRLAQVHHFDPASLEANRAGNLSGEQSLRLTWMAGLYFLGAIVSIAIGTGILFLFFTTSKPSDPIAAVMIMTLFFGLGGLYVLWRGFLILSDALSGKVESAQGHVHKSIWRGRATSYHYNVGNLHWRVSRQAYNALVEGIAYHVYYAPRSRKLVAIEPI